ncbi:hypothetical protein BDZ89DRAFT_1145830 [Hymenopellis radicata]|nr:hypothetical protein BDZ89DRAFT_1145830 [Hymenopellis radicata]
MPKKGIGRLTRVSERNGRRGGHSISTLDLKKPFDASLILKASTLIIETPSNVQKSGISNEERVHGHEGQEQEHVDRVQLNAASSRLCISFLVAQNLFLCSINALAPSALLGMINPSIINFEFRTMERWNWTIVDSLVGQASIRVKSAGSTPMVSASMMDEPADDTGRLSTDTGARTLTPPPSLFESSHDSFWWSTWLRVASCRWPVLVSPSTDMPAHYTLHKHPSHNKPYSNGAARAGARDLDNSSVINKALLSDSENKAPFRFSLLCISVDLPDFVQVTAKKDLRLKVLAAELCCLRQAYIAVLEERKTLQNSYRKLQEEKDAVDQTLLKYTQSFREFQELLEAAPAWLREGCDASRT